MAHIIQPNNHYIVFLHQIMNSMSQLVFLSSKAKRAIMGSVDTYPGPGVVVVVVVVVVVIIIIIIIIIIMVYFD